IHCFSSKVNQKIFTPFHLAQAVPILMLILGFTHTLSFKNKNLKKIKECYSKYYFKNKFNRFIIPFLIAYFIGIIINYFFQNKIVLGMLENGEGNYWMYYLFQFIIVFPLLYYFYQKNSRKTIIISFIIVIIYQLSFYVFENRGIIFNIQKLLLFRELGYIVLGMWFADKYNYKEKQYFLKQYKYLFILFVISIVYYILNIVYGESFVKLLYLRTFHFPSKDFFSYIYVLMFVILGVIYLPDECKNFLTKFLKYIGKASYHIYLFQTLFFIAMYFIFNSTFGYDILTNLIFAFFILVYCIIGGILFYEFDKRILIFSN
ncbi:MAG: acyltransferase family protein, partial [Candidatus Hermodarchaeota archaeon]